MTKVLTYPVSIVTDRAPGRLLSVSLTLPNLLLLVGLTVLLLGIITVN